MSSFLDKMNELFRKKENTFDNTPTEKNTYQASGNFRTTDLNYSIARVGTELTNLLKNLVFFKILKIGINKIIIIAPAINYPIKLYTLASNIESAFSPQISLLLPNGIAPLSSTTGIIEIKIVAKIGLLPKIAKTIF